MARRLFARQRVDGCAATSTRRTSAKHLVKTPEQCKGVRLTHFRKHIEKLHHVRHRSRIPEFAAVVSQYSISQPHRFTRSHGVEVISAAFSDQRDLRCKMQDSSRIVWKRLLQKLHEMMSRRRCWQDKRTGETPAEKRAAQQALYGNRRRIRGDRGRGLQRRRGELVERPLAHQYETAGLRRVWVRGHENVRKRVLIQAAGCNLGLLLRRLTGVGTPRSLQGRALSAILGLIGRLIKAEVVRLGDREPRDNPRFVVTNLRQTPRFIYEKVYCARGDIENRIKELLDGLQIDRTSCCLFSANQLRVFLTAAAYVLMQELRLLAARTACARSQVTWLRDRLLKLGVHVVRSVRRVVLHLPRSTPHLEAWRHIALALGARAG